MTDSEYNLSFSASSSTDNGSFKLVELPSDLYKLIEGAINDDTPLNLSVKGHPGEDAVLCTYDKTFTMRSIILSNSVLVVTPPPDTPSYNFSDSEIVIRDQVNEVIELTPCVPKLHKLSTLLRGKEYDEGYEGEVIDDQEEQGKFTYEDARSTIQASDLELDRGLSERHILNIYGELKPIAPAYLNQLLELFLNLLVSLSLSCDAVPIGEFSSTLADEHQVPRAVSTQVMSWFGDMCEGLWKMNVNAVMKEVGLGILRQHRHEPIEKNELMTKWRSLVGDTFENTVSLSLLSGNYLASQTNAEMLLYFPTSSLPVDAASRFADLFLTRSRWKGEDISPFLADIAINAKERDKLLLKFARATTDAEGIWYTARAQYNG